jgi:ketosteroid isomerase-like protein
VISQRNVDHVRRVFETVQSGVADARAFVAEFWDPDGYFCPLRGLPDAGPRHGLDDITSYFTSFIEIWDSYVLVPRTVDAVGNDRVLVRVTVSARGRDSHLALEGDVCCCIWLRNGRIMRWEDHRTEVGALNALGVNDQPLEPGAGPNA